MKKLFFVFVALISLPVFAQTGDYKYYPTNWWTGMKWSRLQVMVHGDKIADNFPAIKMGPGGIKLAAGVKLTRIERVENPNYIFLDLLIDATAKPGKFSFPFVK